MSSSDNLPSATRYLPIWRWIFLCSEAALITLVATSIYGWRNGINKNIDQFYYPFRGGLVVLILWLTIAFQFFVAPLFFRRLGFLALVAWVSALAAFVWINQPVF